SRRTAQATRSHACPEPRVLDSSTFQHPGSGNTQPVPHSWPGRCQFDPPCSSSQASFAFFPPGPVAFTSSGPSPVIRHTILTSSPASNGTCANSNPQTSASSELPRTSSQCPVCSSGVPLQVSSVRVGTGVAAATPAGEPVPAADG